MQLRNYTRCDECGKVVRRGRVVRANGLLCRRYLQEVLVRRSPISRPVMAELFATLLIAVSLICALVLAVPAWLMQGTGHTKPAVLRASLALTGAATVAALTAAALQFRTDLWTLATLNRAGKCATATVGWLAAGSLAGFLFAFVTCCAGM
jgi:hypothetical protein